MLSMPLEIMHVPALICAAAAKAKNGFLAV